MTNIFYYCLTDGYECFEDYIDSLGIITKKVYYDTNDDICNRDFNRDIHIFRYFLPSFLSAQPNILVINTEQMSAPVRYNHVAQLIKRGVSIIDYSMVNIKILQQNFPTAQIWYIPYQWSAVETKRLIGYSTKPCIDVGIVNCATGTRRQEILTQLQAAGINAIDIRGWQDDRDRTIGNCKMLLNVHYNKSCTVFESIRCDRWLFAGKLVVSEQSQYTDTLDIRDHVIFTTDIVADVKKLLAEIPTPKPVPQEIITARRKPLQIFLDYITNMGSNTKSICLVMIVKNESQVIKRCLDSVKDYIDHWVICDTGSTDGTQEIIKDYFSKYKIPGKLLNHQWKNFGHNRTLAVQNAQDTADYLLLMDADFVFQIKDPDFKSKLTNKAYLIKYAGNLDYRQLLLVSGKYSWKYVGVTHEYLHCENVDRRSYKKCNGFMFNHLADGGMRKEKFTRDIQLLKDGLKDEPTNVRYMFYLAQSYKDIGDYSNAIKWYTTRIVAGGWEQENYYARYQKAVCMYKKVGNVTSEVIEAFMDAYEYRPTRLEALHDLVRALRLESRYNEAFRYGIRGYGTVYPDDVLFIDKAVHEWKFDDELSLVAFYIGRRDFSKMVYDRLYSENKFSESDRERLYKNYHFYTKSDICNDF